MEVASDAIRARKRPKVVIEAMVLFEDDHYVLDWILRCHGGLCQFGHE